MVTHKGGRVRQGLLCVLAMAALAGCQENTAGYSAISARVPPKPALDLTAQSGVPVTAPGAISPTELAQTRRITSRANAFALLGEEVTFNESQWTENILAGQGGYALEIVPTLEDPGEQPPVIEPVPNWRLSGVLIGNGVMALLDTGAQTYEIRPGMDVPGTEWRVMAIDSDRALLARGGNKLPREFWVSLSGPITGPGVTVEGQGGQGPGQGGRPGIGDPAGGGGGQGQASR